MKQNRINTTSVREIKSSFKRFLSLLVMSMLGVGVFVGIKMASLDMMKSVDKYYDDSNYYDVKVVSTLGITNDDIKELQKLDGIKDVYGSYSKDVLIKNNNEEVVIKVSGITSNINKVQVTSGKLPKTNKEIVVEDAMLVRENLKIGDNITLLDEGSFKETKLKVVGTVKSPLFITNSGSSANRGNTTIGSGKINYYTYVSSNNFDIDYFTESYITLDDAISKTTNSKEYNKIVDNALAKLDKIKNSRQKARYDEIYNGIKEEIDKNEAAGNNKLNAAKNKLDAANIELINANNEILSSKTRLDNALITLNDSKYKLDTFKKTLDENKIKLDNAKKEIEQGKEKLNNELNAYGLTLEDINNLPDKINKIEIPKDKVIELIPNDKVIELIPNDIPNYDMVVEAIDKIYELNLDDKFKDFIMDPEKKEELIKNIPEDLPNRDLIIETIEKLPEQSDIEDYLTNPDNIDKIIGVIPEGMPGHNEIVNSLNKIKENSIKVLELRDGIKKLQEAEEEYNKGLLEYNNALALYNENNNTYINYYNEYQNGLSEYNNGLKIYNSNLNLYNSNLREYYNSKKAFDLKIIEAKKKLDEIPEAKWYIYNRLDDKGYSSFIDDGESVSNLSKVFPTIFFVVAVLISLISMSRMVEDDRLLIGTFKSLGFSNKHIRKKYLLYSGIATILGGLIGALLGFLLLPRFIWNIYKILFDVPVFKYDLNPTNTIIGILIAVICICGTTILTIRKVVKEKPSELMRPKAPENGKRVILEKIPFIWNNINFSNKITIRNLFRYKKRVIMTVGGILGCTALMLAGFGIRDSVVNIPGKQYNEVFHFDEMVYLTDNLSNSDVNEIFNDKDIINRLDTKMDISMTSDNYNINLFIPENEKDIKNVLELRDVKTKNKLKFKDNKVIISNKLAELENKKIGDKITITDSENNSYEFIISGICENYVGHYVFMNKKTYEEKIGKYNTNITYLNITNSKVEKSLTNRLMNNKNVMSIVSVDSTINFIDDMLKSLNSVVLILIVLSGALSFVVLYNLSYINISERKREIATLKVLGFTDKEVDKYITKETIILTIIGIALGLVFGIFLTGVIIDTVEIEMVRFLHTIKPASFIITSIIVMIFTLIVNRIIHYALKKIDMIESLKSVE